MFFIIITASKGIESVVCRRNLFRGKKQIKGKEGGARARLARLLKDFRDGWARGSGVGEIGKKKSRLEQGAEKIQTEKLCPREAEFIVCPRSISPVFSSSSSSFSISISCPYPAPVGTLWSRRKYLNDIFFLPLPVLLRSKNYTSRLCSWCTGTAINCLSFLSRDINHRGNKIFLLTRRRERQSFDIPAIYSRE